jgi:membrane-associated phospholipid phosphatase
MKPLRTGAAIVFLLLMSAIARAASDRATSDQVEPKAGSWKTWVIASGSEFRAPAPPSAAATAAEIAELRRLAKGRDGTAKDQIAYWNVGPPSYRWQQIALAEAMRNNLSWNYAIRDFALLHVAICDAMVAAWDSKYAYRRKRPSEFDPSLSPALPNPHCPSYPAEHAVAAGAAAAVLSYLFPDRASYFAELADSAGRSRRRRGSPVSGPAFTTAVTLSRVRPSAAPLPTRSSPAPKTTARAEQGQVPSRLAA